LELLNLGKLAALSHPRNKLRCAPIAQSYKHLADKAFDFWLKRGAVLVIVILQVVIKVRNSPTFLRRLRPSTN
jgi:hypothetical protein